jgi:hypothetical protein
LLRLSLLGGQASRGGTPELRLSGALRRAKPVDLTPGSRTEPADAPKLLFDRMARGQAFRD